MQNVSHLPSAYKKLPHSRDTYLGYVVAMRDPLNIHVDIYWPSEVENRYNSAINYTYTYVSEELDEEVHARTAYCCHLRGVEIVSKDGENFSNMKEAYIFMSKRIAQSGGWVLISVSDIDIYRRILVNMFDIITRRSYNQELLTKKSSGSGENIAKEYIRPLQNRPMFQPDTDSIDKDYHIIYNSDSPRYTMNQ